VRCRRGLKTKPRALQPIGIIPSKRNGRRVGLPMGPEPQNHGRNGVNGPSLFLLYLEKDQLGLRGKDGRGIVAFRKEREWDICGDLIRLR